VLGAEWRTLPAGDAPLAWIDAARARVGGAVLRVGAG